MMNDRFSAQLRQHLLDTAHEHPADGQLAAVLDLVADTPQRPPLVARLAWFPGRIGPIPSTALRWALIAAALLAATMAVAILGGGSSRSTVFEGTWTSTDPLDESRQTLVVAAGMAPAVHFVDDLATGGACDFDLVKVFTADGTGQVSGSLLVVSYPDGGGCGLMTVPIETWFFDYHEATDTLLASDGLTWSRAGYGGDPTGPPLAESPTASSPTSQPSATPDPACIDFPVGGAYQAPAGTLALTVDLPHASDDASWSGIEDVFRVENASCLIGGPVRIEAEPITRVYTDLCDPAAAAIAVDSSAAAMAILATLVGLDEVGPTEVTLDGYSGRRLDFFVRADFGATGCPDGSGRAFDGLSNFDPERSATVHLLDVDGTLLALVTYWSADPDPDTVAEVDAIVASLRIEP